MKRDKPSYDQKVLTGEVAEKVLLADVSNILKKVKSGKTLSKHEREILAQAGDAPAKPPQAASDPEWVSSDEKLGALLGLHRASLPRIRKQYATAPRPRANGEHNVAAWREFLRKHPDIECRSGPASSAKDAIEQEKLRALKRDNDAAEGLLLGRDLVIDSNRRLAAALKNLLRKLLNEMPGAVAGKDIPQAREYGGRLYDDLMREIASWEKEWP